MRLLLDTNIIIHREARTVVRQDIGHLFRWIERLGHQKCIHPDTLEEISRHGDPDVVRTLRVKLDSYSVLMSRASDTEAITELRSQDRSANDHVDTSLLAELVSGRVDAILTEDRNLHRKAAALGLEASVYTIDAFLERVRDENPEPSEYGVLAVRRRRFGEIPIDDAFFDSFRRDYPGFNRWFARKCDEWAYVCCGENGAILAFLYLKPEAADEPYGDMTPQLPPANRVKIGTFKVVSNGYRLGERFLKIVFDYALRRKAEAIYTTLFRTSPEHERLYHLLQDWGFVHFGTKRTLGSQLDEDVLVRTLDAQALRTNPRLTYPYVSGSARKFVVPIYPEFHTELFPDSYLRTERPSDYVDNRPHRNAISKVYVSRSLYRNLDPGDAIVFYRTGSGAGAARYTAVATSLGIVQSTYNDIMNEDAFVELCGNRSVFTSTQLRAYWRERTIRPFIVNFLYVATFRKKPNLKELQDNRILSSAPRGFERLSDDAFRRLMEVAGADTRLIVD